MSNTTRIEKAYELAREDYAGIGVDTEKAIEQLDHTAISLHCWQADDVGGFEKEGASLEGGGIQATGNYPGKARNIDELRSDLKKAYSLIPGNHRFNMHASYGDYQGKFKDRNQIGPESFQSWVDWAKELGIKIDFNSTLFSHPKANDGFTLASLDKGIRDFWIDHVNCCREISAFFGKELGSRCVHNIWIPDGSKDVTVNRFKQRELLTQSLDTILEKKYDNALMRDAVEAKLFGIGSEAFTVGSHEFYLGYAISRETMLCIDIGHFHPTESCADKVSSVFQFIDELLFHVTRGIRWDSDHVVTLNDPVRELMQEIVWMNALSRVCIGLDFFDASINRVGAYVVGTRAAQKALLLALLDPIQQLREYEENGQFFERLALLEEAKAKPFGAVWDYYCMKKGVPVGEAFIKEVQAYERDVTMKRG